MVCSAWRHAAFARQGAGLVSRTKLNNKFDGDTCSFTPVLTTEGIEEIKALLNSKEYYVGIDGRMNFSCGGDISNLVFLEMTDTLKTD